MSISKMNYLSRVLMAAGVAVVNSHTDQCLKLKSGIKSFHQGKKAFTSSSSSGLDPADLRSFSGVLSSKLGGFVAGEERRKQSEDSLRRVMYLSCWGPS